MASDVALALSSIGTDRRIAGILAVRVDGGSRNG
jgi:hypothetical protein